jgi:Skp family chaperone for outer membrane proteins
MKKYTVAAVTILMLAVLAIATTASAQVKVGTVDLQRVRSESDQFKDALKDIDDMIEDFETRRDRQQRELEELSEDFNDAQQRGLTGSMERLQSELQDKSMEFQKFMEETFGTDGIVESHSAELLTPLYDKLAEASENVAEDMGLDLVLDLETVNPLFADKKLDVTDAVLEELAKLR